MANRIFLRRGLDADIPTLGVGEPGFAYDTGRFYIGSPTGNIMVAQVSGGGTGPQGPQGDQGPQGPTGPAGAAGAPFVIRAIYADRATLEADMAPVHDADGTTPFGLGEFAIVNTGNVEDGDNGRLYMWDGSSFAFVTDLSGSMGLTGPMGPAGADGSDGAQGPVGADGRSAYQVALDEGFVGDETAWLASLVGPAGADGADGAQGVQGIQGDPGVAGNDGAAGADGADGDSAYDIAVASGFVGDETAWLASLVGPQGAAGADGSDGLDGAQGPQGDPGADGSDGAAGSDGVDGRTILSGAVDPTTEGEDGDFYINISSNTLFGPKVGGSWGAGTSLVGPQGLAGNDGAQGPQGDPGADGADGSQGPQGLPGADGADGADGDATAYTAANAADWNGSAPATIAEALDRVAAALGPIA